MLYRPITDGFSLFTMDQFIQPVKELQMLALLNFLESERLVRLNDIIRVRRRRVAGNRFSGIMAGGMAGKIKINKIKTEQ